MFQANAASAGMSVSDECTLKFMELKSKKTYWYIISKIDEKLQQITLEKTGAPGASYGDFNCTTSWEGLLIWDLWFRLHHWGQLTEEQNLFHCMLSDPYSGLGKLKLWNHLCFCFIFAILFFRGEADGIKQRFSLSLEREGSSQDMFLFELQDAFCSGFLRQLCYQHFSFHGCSALVISLHSSM